MYTEILGVLIIFGHLCTLQNGQKVTVLLLTMYCVCVYVCVCVCVCARHVL
jgi:hypothetical protein